MNSNEILNENIIRIKAFLVFVRYPAFPKVLGTYGNTWGSTVWRVSEVIKGELNKETFGNTEITIVGDFYEPVDSEKCYTIIVKEVVHPKYGLQYELQSIVEEIDFTQLKNQKEFLQVFLTENQINEMYKIFGNPIEIIANHDKESLKKVKGIGDYIANSIIDRFEKHKDNSKAYIELNQYNLTPKLISKLITHYDNNVNKVINIVKNTPYELVEIDGIGFKKADEVALKVGVPFKSPERVGAFIKYYLEQRAQEGHSYIYSSEITKDLFNEFDGKENILEVYKDSEGNIIDNNINQAMERLKKSNELFIEEIEDKSNRRVYLTKYYELEEQICAHLKRLLNSENKFDYKDWEQILKTQEEQQGWQFTEEQRQGIKLGLDKQVCFITGGAGTGKSSLVAGILSVLHKYDFAQCSLSGKAAARLKEVTGEDGYTIHRLLKYVPRMGFEHNESNPLRYDIIIVDELSLIGGEIFLSLLKAIPNGTKLILLGDMGQLESIGTMNLASDIYHSELIPMQELTKIHRQAQKSGIITSSYSVRQGEKIFDRDFDGKEIVGELQDMILDISFTKDEIKDTVVKYFKEYYYGDLVKEDVMNIQLISPVKERGDSCVFNLNQAIQELINPENPNKREIKVTLNEDKYYYLREDDKVICIANNYNMPTIDGQEVDIFNGWTGKIVSIDLINGRATVYFPLIDATVLFLNLSEFEKNVMLGYAITCHKMQGASAKVIIGAIDFSTPPKMLTKELLYTLITRAEKLCVLVGQNKAVINAIKNSGVEEKKTFLKEMLDGDYITEKNTKIKSLDRYIK